MSEALSLHFHTINMDGLIKITANDGGVINGLMVRFMVIESLASPSDTITEKESSVVIGIWLISKCLRGCHSHRQLPSMRGCNEKGYTSCAELVSISFALSSPDTQWLMNLQRSLLIWGRSLGNGRCFVWGE